MLCFAILLVCWLEFKKKMVKKVVVYKMHRFHGLTPDYQNHRVLISESMYAKYLAEVLFIKVILIALYIVNNQTVLLDYL